MTPREKFQMALEGKQPPGRVPHFELVFFLTMEVYPRKSPSDPKPALGISRNESNRQIRKVRGLPCSAAESEAVTSTVGRQKGSRSAYGLPGDIRGPQLGTQQVLAAEDVQRQVAVVAVVAVKEPPRLTAVDRVGGGIGYKSRNTSTNKS